MATPITPLPIADQMLSIGARTDIVDSNGATSFEIALDSGNQEALQLISRRDSYQKYLYFIEKYSTHLEKGADCNNSNGRHNSITTFKRITSSRSSRIVIFSSVVVLFNNISFLFIRSKAPCALLRSVQDDSSFLDGFRGTI